MNSDPTHGEVHLIQHNVIKFVSDLQQFDSFLQVLWFPPSIKLTIIIVPEEQSFKVKTEDWVSEQPYKKYFKIYVTKVANKITFAIYCASDCD
jgi:hypothetical protein